MQRKLVQDPVPTDVTEKNVLGRQDDAPAYPEVVVRLVAAHSLWVPDIAQRIYRTLKRMLPAAFAAPLVLLATLQSHSEQHQTLDSWAHFQPKSGAPRV
eukprot:331370-Rhodomonas_salina.1